MLDLNDEERKIIVNQCGGVGLKITAKINFTILKVEL